MNNNLSIDFELFEKIIFYNSIMDNDYLETILEYIKPSFFKDKKIKRLFEVLKDYYEEFDCAPNLTELKTHLITEDDKQAFKETVLSFQSLDKKYNKDVLLKNTERFLKEKSVIDTVQKTSLNLQSGNIDSTKILDDFEKACSISLIENIGFDYLESIDEHCEDLQKVFKVIPTGWKWLDNKIGGGFMSEGRALYVFFGVTNVGKSIFLGNIATNILNQDKTVLLITLEMPEQVYAKRISSQLSQIPFDGLSSSLVKLKNTINEYKIKNRKSKLIIKEFPPKGVSVLNIKTYINKLVKKGIKPDAIVVDYINLISPNTSASTNSYESIKTITESLRALSYTFSCPVISATQATRSAVNSGELDLDKTSESMGLSHTVDAQFSIWTEDGDTDLGIIHMGIVKNRFGPRKHTTILGIDYPTLTLKEIDEDGILKDNSDSKMPNITDDIEKALLCEESSDSNDISQTLNKLNFLSDNN
jgi:replicative DNA helicase